MFAARMRASSSTAPLRCRAAPDEALLRAARALVPPLGAEGQYKGGAGGRVGVVGGCAEYTGAPYFAAAAALRAGADLAHVFCAPEAAAALKAYSPELIVHPLLVDSSAGGGGGDGNGGGNGSGSGGELEAWVKRMDALVVGPGLGRAPGVVDAARRALAVAREASLPVALDADALWLVSEDLALGAAPRTVLTPNANELGRLMAAAAPEALEALGLPRGARPSPRQAAMALATALEGATVLGKGEVDVVAAVDVGADDGGMVVTGEVAGSGSPRRCGGQGDVLAGTLAAFLAWHRRGSGDGGAGGVPPEVAAGWAAATLTRRAAARAFARRKRSMLASDVLEELGGAVEEMFPVAR